AEGGLQELSRFDREKLDTQMDQLRAQISALRARLAQLAIAAPVDGVVLTEQLQRLNGAFVREGEQLMELGDIQKWQVQLNVPERDVHKIRLGDSVKVELPAFDESERRRLGGRVEYIAPEPLSAQGSGDPGGAAPAPVPSGFYRVTATLDRKQLEKMGIDKFRRGYTVQGNVITRSGRIMTLLWNYLSEKIGA
ncbi:MAG: efflux RND transporter periplasmic adaptor subunit, partial [Gemmatimonadetes bacterium]|nr:efflux RND transporter periplasmic adaptor subunit [Gemmatimonadota bacterium]